MQNGDVQYAMLLKKCLNICPTNTATTAEICRKPIRKLKGAWISFKGTNFINILKFNRYDIRTRNDVPDYECSHNLTRQ